VVERCPKCSHPLLSLGWTALKQCERCDGYVEPDGSWVERREGDIRYAETMGREDPKTVAELAAELRSPPETLREDLQELCRRHRSHHRRWLDEETPWLVVERAAHPPAYRDSHLGGKVVVRTQRHGRKAPRWAWWATGYAPLGLIGGLVLTQSVVPLGVVLMATGAVSWLTGPQRLMLASHEARIQPVVRFEWLQGSGELSVHHSKTVTKLSRAEVWVELESTMAPLRQSFRAWLVAPGFRLKVADQRSHGQLRERVIRLENALALDATPPR
jgi:hypothetical protein